MISLTVGRLLRREVRRAFMEAGADFTEEKGWLDSLFIIRNEQNPKVGRVLDAISATLK